MSPPVSPWTLTTVKFFDPLKKWGYLKRTSGPDIFLHIANVRESGYTGRLTENTLIEVQFIEDKRGLKAIHIRAPE